MTKKTDGEWGATRYFSLTINRFIPPHEGSFRTVIDQAASHQDRYVQEEDKKSFVLNSLP